MSRFGVGLLSICIFSFSLTAQIEGRAPAATEQSQFTLQGTIQGPSGIPVAGARVDVRKTDSPDEILADTLSDVDGKFALFGIILPPGDYLIHASAVGYDGDEKEFEISRGPSVPSLTFALVLKVPVKARGISPRFTVVRVFYATDRKAGMDHNSVQYLGVRSDNGTLAYGFCEVSIPETHSIANMERPSIWKFEFRPDPEKHMVLQKVEPESKDVFFKEVSGTVKSSPTKDAFVFIHGYNVSFENAAIRTAQLAYDFGFKGAPILYSWPSRGSLLGYLDDEESVKQTVGNLKQFLQEVADKSGATVVHLIAHSMGNRALLPAVSQLAADTHFKKFNEFHTIVLAAPDVDRDVFMKLVEQIRKPENKIALYVSERDQALAASHMLFHKEQRAGAGGGNSIVMPGVDTIDVSKISVDALGHSYYGDSRSVVSDLLEFLKGALPPRMGLTRISVGSLGYWQLSAPD